MKIIDIGTFLFYFIKISFPFIFYLSGGKTYQPALVVAQLLNSLHFHEIKGSLSCSQELVRVSVLIDIFINPVLIFYCCTKAFELHNVNSVVKLIISRCWRAEIPSLLGNTATQGFNSGITKLTVEISRYIWWNRG